MLISPLLVSRLGLYVCEKYWEAKGNTGFKIYKYFFRRLAGQAKAPWEKGFVAPPPWSASQHHNIVAVRIYSLKNKKNKRFALFMFVFRRNRRRRQITKTGTIRTAKTNPISIQT